MKKKVSITLDEEVMKKIRILDEKSERSFSQCANIILKAYLKKDYNE